MQLEVLRRDAFADGFEFDGGGAFEMITCRARYAVDPLDPRNQPIADLEFAPVGDGGLVRFSGDVHILRPVAAGNARLFFEWGNRGNKAALQDFCDGPATNTPSTLADAGNGFLFRRGYTIVFGAWQGDLLAGQDRMLLDLPIAMDSDGYPVRGLARSEFIVDVSTQSVPLSGRANTRSHPAVSTDSTAARLFRRRYPYDAPEELPADQWEFARLQGDIGQAGDQPGVVPCRESLYVPAGLQPGWIYELIYEATSPLILGLGHAAVRDLVSFLRFDSTSPVAGIERAYGWGKSQTGRAIRDFIYHGFNEDTAGRQVFDGVLPHVAGAGKLDMRRFANLTVTAGQQYEDHLNPSDSFPFAYAESVDHLTGARDAILKRPASDPKVLHTQSSTEYWQRRGSLVHTSTDGQDLPFPDGVRGYLWSSSQHAPNALTGSPQGEVREYPENAVATTGLFRAMLDAMDAWVSRGVPPPPSAVPTRADGTLITAADWREQFPRIPGASTPSGPNELCSVDFSTQPPNADRSGQYVVLVPAVDGDGNEVAGVRAPMVSAPLATYVGWNLRTAGFGSGAMYGLSGGMFAFVDSASQAALIGDPRPSVQSRYPDVAGYVVAITRAAQELTDRRLLLDEDVPRAAAAAADWFSSRRQVHVS